MQPVLLQELDHVTIEQPRLLDLAGMAGAVQDLHLAAGDALLERRRAWMRGVFAAGEDDGRAFYARVVILGVRLGQRLKLINDRLRVGVRVAPSEQIGEVVRQRRGAERRAEILERVTPAVIDALRGVGGDAARGELLAGIVAGAGKDQR